MKLIEGSPEPELLPMRLTPLTRALWEGIPAFVALKKDGVRIEDIAAAFKGWDSAVDDGLIATTVNRLVTAPVIETPEVAGILQREAIRPIQKHAALRGIADKMVVYEIP